MGMRHRSAVGISEQADVLAIVVSEETGTISLAEDGSLLRRLTPELLRGKLKHYLNVTGKSRMDDDLKTDIDVLNTME